MGDEQDEAAAGARPAMVLKLRLPETEGDQEQQEDEEVQLVDPPKAKRGATTATGKRPRVQEEASGKRRKVACPADVDPEVFASLPPELQEEVAGELQEEVAGDAAVASVAGGLGQSDAPAALEALTFLSYNVWFREDVALEARIKAIVGIVAGRRPTVVAFQEVTPSILRMLAKPLTSLGYDTKLQTASSSRGGVPPYFVVIASQIKWDWCKERHYADSQMGRCLLYGQLTVPLRGRTAKILVGTTHLESAVPPFNGPALMAEPRKQQLQTALRVLQAQRCPCVLLGDLNWNEGGRPYVRNPAKLTQVLDGPMPLPEGWRDAWTAAHPDAAGAGFTASCTYNAKANPMLGGGLMFRPDRLLLCDLPETAGLKLVPAKALLVGQTPIEGATMERRGKPCDVLPSDHFGLLVKLTVARRPSS